MRPARAAPVLPQLAGVVGEVAEHLLQVLPLDGYTDVHGVKWDDGAWEVEAISPAGRSVDLRVDPATGAVVHEEIGWAVDNRLGRVLTPRRTPG